MYWLYTTRVIGYKRSCKKKDLGLKELIGATEDEVYSQDLGSKIEQIQLPWKTKLHK